MAQCRAGIPFPLPVHGKWFAPYGLEPAELVSKNFARVRATPKEVGTARGAEHARQSTPGRMTRVFMNVSLSIRWPCFDGLLS